MYLSSMALLRIPLMTGMLGLLLFGAFGVQAQSANCGGAKTAAESRSGKFLSLVNRM
jgi:hypothetical protein